MRMGQGLCHKCCIVCMTDCWEHTYVLSWHNELFASINQWHDCTFQPSPPHMSNLLCLVMWCGYSFAFSQSLPLLQLSWGLVNWCNLGIHNLTQSMIASTILWCATFLATAAFSQKLDTAFNFLLDFLSSQSNRYLFHSYHKLQSYDWAVQLYHDSCAADYHSKQPHNFVAYQNYLLRQLWKLQVVIHPICYRCVAPQHDGWQSNHACQESLCILVY